MPVYDQLTKDQQEAWSVFVCIPVMPGQPMINKCDLEQWKNPKVMSAGVNKAIEIPFYL
jgi:hypothetical protein